MNNCKINNFFSKISIKEYVENVRLAIENLEKMEKSDTKLECYKEAKTLIKKSSNSILKIFLLRALVFMVFFLLFLLAIAFVDNNVVQIVSFVVLGICGIYLISPMLPPPLAVYQSKLRKMMKKDGVRYRDCTIKKKE